MSKMDRGVGIVVAALLGCVAVRAVLEAALALLIPALVLSTVYVVFRGRQLGWFRKILPAEEQHTDV